MLAVLKSHIVVLAVQGFVVTTAGVDSAEETHKANGARASWAGKAEIQVGLDEEGEISFDSPLQVRLEGKVTIETDDFRLRADRLSYDSTTNGLLLEASDADGAQISLRTPNGRQSLRIVGRRLLLRFRDKKLIAEGAGAMRVEDNTRDLRMPKDGRRAEQ